MEYARDKIFTIRYNKLEDKLEYCNDTNVGSRIQKFLKRNSFIISVVSIGILFSIINVVLIVNFFNLIVNYIYY